MPNMHETTRLKADIVPFTVEYSRVVHSWIDSEETYRNLCRGTEFPPPDDLVDSWQREGIAAYLLFSAGKLVAYGELWDRPLERAVEIAHLIVAPACRLQGYGSKMLELLYQRAAAREHVAKVMLNFFGSDAAALGCYLKAGFELVGSTRVVPGLRMERLVRIK
ncbi:MAG TPA: GNAT family N-acetyltransferase [Candidatus Deferrimicrobium sp.]|nr:GNAT family N-acetyltransferase [Candidatus Deferrimicrobium sp.]